MRTSIAPARGALALALALTATLGATLAACGPSYPHAPLKKPNDELIVGDFTRRGGDGKAAIRFARDGSYRLVKDKDSFDQAPPLGDGTWKIAEDQLTLSAQHGQCTEGSGVGDEREATYKVVVSKVGVRFEKVNDSCERRATMDGQTWWRVR
jgi:hypothetical protein